MPINPAKTAYILGKSRVLREDFRRKSPRSDMKCNADYWVGRSDGLAF
jgi:hypothetical protein